MSELSPVAAARPLLRVWARPGAPPTGLLFGTIGALAGVAVSVLHLDRLPITLCMFKGMTGLPCPTCGGTRAFGRLFRGDLTGAVLMNPLVVLGALLVFGWAIADLALLPKRRALALELHPRLAQVLRVTAVLLLLLNWAFLLAVRR